MIDSIVEISKEHGTWAAVCTVLSIGLWKVDQRSRSNAQSLESIHDGCHIPVGAVEDLQDRVTSLETADNGMVTEISVVKTKLETLDRVEGKLDQVLMHLSIKGLDS